MNFIVFDFDGVIVDSQEALLNAFNDIARKKKRDLLLKEDYHNMASREIFKKFNIRWFQRSFYIKQIKNLIIEYSQLIKLEQNILDFFSFNFQNQHEFSILSSNSEKLISTYIKSNLQNVFFKNVICDVPLFSKHKKITQFIKKNNINKKQFIYVGDEVRDILAAQKAGVRSIAVLWGKDNETLLRNSKPSYMAKNGLELAGIIESLSQNP